jgi:hypothetical protein
MTSKQQLWFNASLWPNACRAQNWKPSDRALKLRVVGEIIGRQIATTKDVEPKQEFNRVKDRLEELAAPIRRSADPEKRTLTSAATLRMLDSLFARGVQRHCRDLGIDRLPRPDVEQLRREWTIAALGRWQDWENLRNRQVDKLKAFLLVKINPDSDQARNDLANAQDEGNRRRFIHRIVANATIIRQLEALALPGQPAPAAESIENYIAAVSGDKHHNARGWRHLLLPILEEQVLITIEERKRAKVQWAEDQQLAHRERVYNGADFIYTGRILVTATRLPLAEHFPASPRPSAPASPSSADPFTTGETPF